MNLDQPMRAPRWRWRLPKATAFLELWGLPQPAGWFWESLDRNQNKNAPGGRWENYQAVHFPAHD